MLIVDDHQVVVEALRNLLDVSEQITVVDVLHSVEQIADSIELHHPDVVLCDLEMPNGDSLECAFEGKHRSPKTQILVLTAYPTDCNIARANCLGVSGFLTKHEPAEAVVDGIHAVHAGHAIYSDEVRRRMIESDGKSDNGLRVLELTPRELTVVRMVAQGMTTAQVAESTYRSPKTIDNQIASAMTKTGSANRVELSRWAIREGLVQP